jgi:hypothetical protein
MGKPFMPWQSFVSDVALEVLPDGRFAYQLVIITVPRQSGKTTTFAVVMDQRALMVLRARVWFTQQSGQDAVDWLLNEHWPLLAPFGNACSLRRAAGSQHVRWKASSGLVRPFPPTPESLHSKVSDLVVIDECWAFDYVKGRQLDQAIVPTQATKPNAQVWKVSTAGDATSAWWLGTVEQGRAAAQAGRTEGVAYFEWSCPDGMDPTDPDSWPRFHPAFGRTIHAPAMQSALELLGPDEFARAYGNRWTSNAARVIPLDAWRRCQDPNAPLPTAGDLALAFDCAPDRSEAAICAAWREADGTARIEVADVRDGVAWLPGRWRELVDIWKPRAGGYDKAGPALDIADVLTRAGMELAGTEAREYAAACAGLLEAIVTDPPAVRIRPNEAMDAAAAAAAQRRLGDAWAWGRRQSAVSIAVLTAGTVALWTYDHAPEDIGAFRIG